MLSLGSETRTVYMSTSLWFMLNRAGEHPFLAPSYLP